MGRFATALAVFFRVLRDPAFGAQVKPLLAPPPPEPAKTVPVEAAQLLFLMQREGRLVDFLRESLSGYSDAQIGAAVRSVHAGGRKVLDEYFAIEPVLRGEEGSDTTIAAGFDPSAIRLVGNVGGNPPFKGVLRHHGWRIAGSRLPPRPAGTDPAIVAPAEVEIS